MSILQEFNKKTTLLYSKIDETLKLATELKETVMKLKQFERAAQIGEMEKQLEGMKKEIFSFKM